MYMFRVSAGSISGLKITKIKINHEKGYGNINIPNTWNLSIR